MSKNTKKSFTLKNRTYKKKSYKVGGASPPSSEKYTENDIKEGIATFNTIFADTGNELTKALLKSLNQIK
jgi:hypothetical protein